MRTNVRAFSAQGYWTRYGVAALIARDNDRGQGFWTDHAPLCLAAARLLGGMSGLPFVFLTPAGPHLKGARWTGGGKATLEQAKIRLAGRQCMNTELGQFSINLLFIWYG